MFLCCQCFYCEASYELPEFGRVCVVWFPSGCAYAHPIGSVSFVAVLRMRLSYLCSCRGPRIIVLFIVVSNNKVVLNDV